MNQYKVKKAGIKLFKKWWCSLLLFPFIIYSLHQAWWTLSYNIFFSISYDFPFPIDIIHLFLDNFLLIIHEAGHTFFGILGWRTLTILGGSLLEVVLPILILIYFWINNKKTGSQLSLYMVGFSLLRVSYYASDAEARQLPLLGGLTKDSHDWFNLLKQWNAMEYDNTIALFLVISGTVFYLLSLLFPAFYFSYKSEKIDLNI